MAATTIRVSGGLGTAVSGWLLALGGFNGAAEVQSAGAISMINFMYLGIPLILTVIMLLIVAKLDVEKANKKLVESRANETAAE